MPTICKIDKAPLQFLLKSGRGGVRWDRGEGGGRGVAFRTVSIRLPDDPRVYLIVIDLDDDGGAVGADVLFR